MGFRLCFGAAAILAGGCGACLAVRESGAAAVAPQTFVGFDRNEYPGDAAMTRLRKQFAFTGYWLTPPPGARTNGWAGKRDTLRGVGYGFLVLADGRLDRQIKASRLPPAQLGRQDATKAVAAARAEGFPPRTIIFLDQEEGGRLLDEQASYLFAWTEAVSASGFRAGIYASGQPAPDGPGVSVTTIQDVREHIARQHLHTVAVWVYQDACAPQGPATGCTLTPPPPEASGTVNVTAWQYAQSPRRPNLTQSCAKTYGADGNCYPPAESHLLVDLNVAASADPSEGR